MEHNQVTFKLYTKAGDHGYRNQYSLEIFIRKYIMPVQPPISYITDKGDLQIQGFTNKKIDIKKYIDQTVVFRCSNF